MLEKLKQKIVEAVPEIMELKFGCRIEIDEVIIMKGIFIRELPEDMIEMKVAGLNHQWFKKDIAKILGRPITLEDVLRALEGVRKLLDERFYVSSKGYLEHIEIPSGDCLGQVDWIFGKSLEEQSKETQEFILEKLK